MKEREPTNDRVADELRRVYGLTPRETEVVEKMLDGRNNLKIAVALAIGVETVRTHVSVAFQKMSIHGRCDLIRIVLTLPSRTRGR